MPKDENIRLQHMLDAAVKAVELTKTRKRVDFDTDETLILATERLLEIIGEASKNISDNLKNTHPEIAWKEIAAFRNRLIHGYFDIDLDILWEIITKDLPPLVESLKEILTSKKK
jgi:uncharacterized protein with HEPN domain